MIIKRTSCLSLFLILLFLQNILNAQIQKPINNNYFDEKIAIEQAISKGIKASEIKGYVEFLKNDFASKKSLATQKHIHTPYENNKIHESVIYLSPAKITSADCPNMGFENNNFSGWTGSIGTVSTGVSGSGSSIYNITANTINNATGNNGPLANTTNYHTIVNLQPINALYPYCWGYDSIGCKAIGTNIMSEIPLVSPFSLDGTSVRMNGACANYRACQLKYITTTSVTNKKLSYSFAFVLDHGGHTSEDSPYFKVEVKNETTGLILSGCNTSMEFNNPILTSDSMFTSATSFAFTTYYRKWQLYTIDLSSLPIGTTVSVNFEVGGCSQGGHFGYAYVDAECGGTASGGGIDYVTSNMCSGSTNASLIAPLGYVSYQWFDPNNNSIAGATSNTLSISNPTAGTIYSVQLIANSGCTETKTVSIATSSITINSISTIGTCSSGDSGSATANVNGSNGPYSYTWTSISTGSVVGNAQTAVNLSPGNYSVNVNSGTCGQASATVNVPIAAPLFSQQQKTYCGGNNTFITAGNGTNFQWYMGSNPIPAPNGINDTLYISNPINGYDYTVVYMNGGNCRDSIRYIITQIASGYLSLTDLKNVCPGNSNGSVVLNLTPVNASPFTYNVSGPGGNILNSSTTATTYSLNSLATGIYTSTVNDGNCTYNNTFTISTIQTNFTMTPGTNSSCSPADTARINFNFGSVAPANCALSMTGNCSAPNSFQLGNGTQVNANTSYPAIYGNFYKNTRHQILYKASELIAAGVQPGKISGISFNISAIAGTTVYPNFTIKMKCTSDIDLTSTTFDNTGLIQVYLSPSQPIILGWNTYSFPTPYEWDGLSNILIDVCNDITTSYTNNSLSPYTTTPFNSVRWMNSDVTPACMTNNLASSYSPNNTYRPNIKFENCEATSPSSYTISVSSNGTMVQNNNNNSIKIVPVTTPTADIVYTITVTNPEGGCSASQTYTMSSNVSAVASSTNATCGSCPNGSVTVTPNCGTGPYTYLWSPGGATTQSVSGLLPGCYSVTVTDANMNTATAQTCVSFVTKLEETTASDGLSIYPNPGNGIFNVLSNDLINKIDIVIFNPLGQSVFSESYTNTKEVAVDISKLSKGIYYLKTTTENGSKLFKLILE